MNYLTRPELMAKGFKSIGENVLISKDARIYNPEEVTIGDNVKIDDFCVFSGPITIGNRIHIGTHVYILGPVTLHDYVSISSFCYLTAKDDDASGNSLIGPMVPIEARIVNIRPIMIGPHSALGAQCTVLPGVTMPIGACL